VLDLVTDIVFALTVAHATAIGFQELVIWLFLLLLLVFFSTEALIDQIEEDALRKVAEFAKRDQEGTLSSQHKVKKRKNFHD